MPVQPGGREGAATSGTDGAIFASVPLWEQDRKGGHRPASDPAMDAGEAGGLGEPVDAAYETQPADVGLQTGYPPRRAAPAGAIIAGAAALAIIAAVGWYASQPRERGVPELTPGGPDGAPVALAVVAPPETSLPGPAPATGEAAKPAPAARRATPPAQTPAPRVRPAPSAGERRRERQRHDAADDRCAQLAGHRPDDGEPPADGPGRPDRSDRACGAAGADAGSDDHALTARA
ncbi:hypothetical protein LJR219_002829 [Phenylobacterium sp. LjRoot219]|uniref:hypothetical protein n=1 Tax=Phenylobacterium sp. LjRoot219 TaxID=3342283 RepID=UPI003ECFC26E